MQIRASKCNIKEVPKEEEKFFLKENHFQGYASSLVCYGLYFNNKLVQLMSFGKPRFNKNYQWEIIRDCSKKSLVVQGGVSKLWKYFLKNNQCHSCICYSYPHDKKLVTKYTDYCGFATIKQAKPEDKVYFTGEWNGKQKRIDKSILERHGVDRLLKTSQGQNRTNEQILLDLGFEKKTEKGMSPQVDIYFPFGILYKITDKDTGQFYIGETTNKNKWDKGYLGSGCHWSNHCKKYPDHDYKREILKSNFKTPKELYRAESKEIKKYAVQKDDKWIIIDPLCMNKKTEEQTVGNKGAVCSECGGVTKHFKTCSQYIKPKPFTPCKICGGKSGHFKWCKLYTPPTPCGECGGIQGHHKEYCSKHKIRKNSIICSECGSKHGAHKKGCSKAKIICKCGAINAISHTKDCPNRKITICDECKSPTSAHKKICSHYKKPHPCTECGAKNGNHHKNCSKFKPRIAKNLCSECNAKRGHFKWCSKYYKNK